MNWILCPVKNNLELTKRAIDSFARQDIGDVQILIILNAAESSIRSYFQTRRDVMTVLLGNPTSVARAWNIGLNWILGDQNQDHCLVCNNDIELLPETYRLLVNRPELFITPIGINDDEGWKIGVPTNLTCREHPDFSCYLMRQKVWNKVHLFDESFKIAYCEDNDYHCRLKQAGITAYSLSIPFLHHASSTIKFCDEGDKKLIQKQAKINREYFFKKWGFRVGSKEYEEFFKNV